MGERYQSRLQSNVRFQPCSFFSITAFFESGELFGSELVYVWRSGYRVCFIHACSELPVQCRKKSAKIASRRSDENLSIRTSGTRISTKFPDCLCRNWTKPFSVVLNVLHNRQCSKIKKIVFRFEIHCPVCMCLSRTPRLSGKISLN